MRERTNSGRRVGGKWESSGGDGGRQCESEHFNMPIINHLYGLRFAGLAENGVVLLVYVT